MLGRCPGPKGPGWVIGRTFGPQENALGQSLDPPTPIRSSTLRFLPARGEPQEGLRWVWAFWKPNLPNVGVLAERDAI